MFQNSKFKTRGELRACPEPSRRESIRNSSSASALLISLILMSVLLVLGLGFNAAIIRQTRLENSIVDAGRAFYAAEAGVERGLYELESQLPGYQTPAPKTASFGPITYQYRILAQNQTVPCDYDQPTRQQWQRLGVNETVRIPLYKDDGVGGRVDITQFTVHFFVNNGTSQADSVGDVLRWKVIGTSPDGFDTDSIGDFYPEDVLGVYEDVFGDDGVADTQVTRFGTSPDANGGYYSTARNHTLDQSGTDSYIFIPNYPISAFFDTSVHVNNTLILVNVVDLSKQLNTDLEKNHIMYRIEMPVPSGTEPLVCTAARVSADGQSNTVRKSLDVSVGLDSFIPVFDFSLYRTKRSNEL